MKRLLVLTLSWFIASTAVAVAPLVTADWVNENLNNDDFVVVDVRYGGGFDQADFAEGHIPGSVFKSYSDGWREDRDGVAGLVPATEDIEALIRSLGVSNDDTVVIASTGDSSSDFGAAARVYWTFKLMGHDTVSILNGGIKGWKQAGFELAAASPATPEPSDFVADFQPQLLATAEDVTGAEDNDIQLVDARPNDFFTGRQQAGPTRVAGTIPGSINLPEETLLSMDGDTAYFITEDRLQALIDEAALKYEGGGTIAFCNTGHWAATDWFALSEIAGLDNVAMYDGSMADWTQDESRPVQTEARGLGRLLQIFGS